ncbi:VPS10 domain-containing protein [Gillisia sp. CAL575]|uniref:VPS10 domain-containing protein n=1 Tax=Gillisia sp. CAL575 TaxID=985255 RepID=UPI0003A8F7C8|nr:glycosyl hydrolase [Gillisia sp. CAL575]
MKAILLKLFILFFFFGIYTETNAQRKKKSVATEIDQEAYAALKFRLIGPFRGGRSAAVTGVPGEPNLFYFGSTGGGIWRSTDGARTWENISDGFFGGSIGAISVANSDHNIIFAGGGEKTLRGNVSSGSGIWKSVDAGKTWESKGLENSRHIPRISIHPTNPEIVYAAVLGNIYKPTEERGVYKSIDGGTTWKKTLFVNDQAGAVDLIMDPNNPRILYASTWRVQRTPYSLSSGGEGSALWKSTDSGETWKEISKNKGFPQDTLGIMGITVSPVNSNRVWAIVENKDKGGVYRSEDAGETWKNINSDRELRQRAWYYTRIYADPKDEDVVYVVNVSYHKSKDGGENFTSARAPHGDHHDMWIAPENPDRIIMGDDGGAQVTYDGGETWSTYHNQPTGQFYRLTTDNHFPYRIYAAQQDNSTIRIDHRSTDYTISEENWEETAGGESAHIAVDPENDNIVYGGSYGGFLTRVNHEKNTQRAINVWPDNPMGHGAEDMKYRFQWNFPIIFSKHDPNKLYTFSNHVHVTTNEGQSWETISEDLTRNDSTKLGSSGGPITQDNTGVEYYGTIFAAEESSLQEGLIWVGSDDGLVHVTKDGGKNWENVTPKGLPKWTQINSLETSDHDAGTAFIAATSYKSGDFAPYLYKTIDFGKSWIKITTGIGTEHFTRVIREDPTNKNILYAGTEEGIYISFDQGANWKAFQLNLPIVPITDLAIKEGNLIVATQGRSIWILDDLSVLHQNKDASTSKTESFLFQPKPTYRIGGGSRSNSKTDGTNHPNGVVTYFNIKELDDKQDTIHLTYFNQANDTLKSFGNQSKEDKLVLEKGSNMFVWDMYQKGAEKLDGMILWWADLEGPRILPGEYSVELNVNGEKQRRTFTVLANPNAESDATGLKEQYDFITDVNTTVDEAHKSIKKIRKITAQLNSFQTQYKGKAEVKDLVEKAKEMEDRFGEIEKALYQTQNKSGQDPLNFPIKLTNKLAHLNSLVGMDDFPPTDQDIAVKNELTSEIKKELSAFNLLIDKEIEDFNRQFNAKNLNYLFLDAQ